MPEQLNTNICGHDDIVGRRCEDGGSIGEVERSVAARGVGRSRDMIGQSGDGYWGGVTEMVPREAAPGSGLKIRRLIFKITRCQSSRRRDLTDFTGFGGWTNNVLRTTVCLAQSVPCHAMEKSCPAVDSRVMPVMSRIKHVMSRNKLRSLGQSRAGQTLHNTNLIHRNSQCAH
eukprot:jgi/Ulvmu1/8728/UM047_0069.1